MKKPFTHSGNPDSAPIAYDHARLSSPTSQGKEACHSHVTLNNVHFDIVGSCQLQCVGCPNSTILDKVTRIDPKVFATCIGNIDVAHVGIFRLFNYGEPLLHDDLPAIFEVLATVPSFSIGSFELSTNAQSARWEQIEEVFRRQMINRLVVSCDGDGTPDSYERYRPPAKWERLIDFLAKARERRDRLCPDMRLVTRSVVFSPNDMERWKQVLEPFGFEPEFRQWKNLVGGAENHSGRPIQIGHDICLFMETKNQLYVGWDGTVVPCCAHPRAGELGSLRTTSLSKILAGVKRAEFINRLQNERFKMKICGMCEFGSSLQPGPSAGDRISQLV
jgi:radical SAM protein with 4Fe4S-binding SPASM domain